MTILVVGNGMVGHRFVEAAVERGLLATHRIVVVGEGLLGLEAANALRLLGLDTTVVEFAPRLMAVQLDDGGARALRRHVESLGIDVRTNAAASAVRTDDEGVVNGLAFAE